MVLKYKKHKPVQLFLVYNSGPLTTVANEVQILCMSFQHFQSFWNDYWDNIFWCLIKVNTVIKEMIF